MGNSSATHDNVIIRKKESIESIVDRVSIRHEQKIEFYPIRHARCMSVCPSHTSAKHLRLKLTISSIPIAMQKLLDLTYSQKFEIEFLQHVMRSSLVGMTVSEGAMNGRMMIDGLFGSQHAVLNQEHSVMPNIFTSSCIGGLAWPRNYIFFILFTSSYKRN